MNSCWHWKHIKYQQLSDFLLYCYQLSKYTFIYNFTRDKTSIRFYRYISLYVLVGCVLNFHITSIFVQACECKTCFALKIYTYVSYPPSPCTVPDHWVAKNAINRFFAFSEPRACPCCQFFFGLWHFLLGVGCLSQGKGGTFDRKKKK